MLLAWLSETSCRLAAAVPRLRKAFVSRFTMYFIYFDVYSM